MRRADRKRRPEPDLGRFGPGPDLGGGLARGSVFRVPTSGNSLVDFIHTVLNEVQLALRRKRNTGT